MKQKNKMLSTHGIKTLFETRLTQLTSLASESQDETAFKNKLNDYLLSGPIYNPAAARQIKRLIDNDGKTIYEASTEQEIKIETISLLWKFLTNRIINEEISVDLWIDLYHQFDRLYHEEEELPDEKQVQQWMKRWPSGLNEDVRAIRRQNKERIISLLIHCLQPWYVPYADSNLLVLYFMGTLVSICLTTLVIEWSRRLLLGKIENKLANAIEKRGAKIKMFADNH